MSILWRTIILGWIYHDSASFFDRLNRLPWYEEYFSSWIQDLKIDDTHNVLDVGCGPGNLIKELTNQGVSAVGVDRSEPMISRARVETPNAKFMVDDALVLAKVENNFDFVIAASLINIIKEPEQLIQTMKKKCREKGCVSVLFPTAQFSKEVPRIINEKKLRGFSAEALRTWGALPPKVESEVVVAIFEKAGLQNVQTHHFFDSGIVSVTGQKSGL